MHNACKVVKRNRSRKNGKAMGWLEAIQEARKLLAENKLRATKLRAAIRHFEESLKRGESWPGATQN
jgi:hypothetical protein